VGYAEPFAQRHYHGVGEVHGQIGVLFDQLDDALRSRRPRARSG
jgi:hypothetical protein